MPSVTVIVPIFNGAHYLPAFFASLQNALPRHSQIILVDDGSTEPVWSTVPVFPAATRVIQLKNDVNLGYSAAVNRAFSLADGDILVQLNTDLVLGARSITALIDLIDREARVGIVGSKLVYPDSGRIQHVGMAFGNYTKPHIFGELPASHPLTSRDRELQIATGATVAMRRQVLDKIGPLDEDYYNHNEDIDHCLMALQHGFRNFVSADSVAYHWESISGPARFARVESSEAMFWSRWGNRVAVDLGRFVDEALDHLLDQAPHLQQTPFVLLDVSRGNDRTIVVDRLEQRWPGLGERQRRYRQTNNPGQHLRLPLLMPHWLVHEPVPFIYLVDRHRELERNTLWFEGRRQVVTSEVVVDLTGCALSTDDLVA